MWGENLLRNICAVKYKGGPKKCKLYGLELGWTGAKTRKYPLRGSRFSNAVGVLTPNNNNARPMGRPHLTWMDMGSLGHMLQIDLPRDWANLALYRDVWRGWSAGAEFRAVFYLFISSFPLRSLLGA